MNKPIKISPSLLAADFAHLAEDIRRVESAGCDRLHVDVMDGHFVPNITVGPVVVKAIRKVTKLPLDVHLMIENPEKYIEAFVDAGADHITFHAEACHGNMGEVIEIVHSHAITCGVSLKPMTPLSCLEESLVNLDRVLLMTVNPGFGGQAFIPEVLIKIKELRSRFSGDIEVDGGINSETSKKVIEAGANVLAAGTAIFGNTNLKQAIEEMRCTA